MNKTGNQTFGDDFAAEGHLRVATNKFTERWDCELFLGPAGPISWGVEKSTLEALPVFFWSPSRS